MGKKQARDDSSQFRSTLPVEGSAKASPAAVRQFQLEAVEGPNRGAKFFSSGDRCTIGSHELNDLVVDEPTVSRFHCEVRVDAPGARVRDLGSRNGTIVDGVLVLEAFLKGGSHLRIGRTVLRFEFTGERNRLPVADETQFGPLVGNSVAMRSCFSLLRRAASVDATVLLEGETGTGKSQAAQAIHEASARKDGPFMVVDCSALAASLLDSELFGHEKGAFTGAAERRVGAFEEAEGGTVFLDEVGELPLDLQPKLLRLLETKEVRKVGSNRYRKVDVRVLAATNRDLRAAVNDGHFRSDLYFRLAVMRIRLPALRERLEDLLPLTKQILSTLGNPSQPDFGDPDFVARLQQFAWPGNVRELRNYLEQCLIFDAALPVGSASVEPSSSPGDDEAPYAQARRIALEQFERKYLGSLMQRFGDKTVAAAQAANMDRVYLYRLLKRHGFKQ